MKRVVVFLGILGILSCGVYSPVTVLPDSIRTVQIKTFTNKTVLYGLEDKLYQELFERFLSDGRLIPTKDKADAVLLGEVKTYELIPLSFDENSVVEQYKLWIEADFCLKEEASGQILLEITDIPIDVRFYPPSTSVPQVTTKTEQEAQDEAIEKLADEIVWQILRNK